MIGAAICVWPYAYVHGLLFDLAYNGRMALDTGQSQEHTAGGAEQEIRELEQKLAEKKRILAEGGVPAREEKEVFREVMREHIGEKVPGIQPAPAPAPAPAAPLMPGITPAGTAPMRDTAEDAAREARLAALVDRAMGSSIESAVNAAQAESPYLLDALHDRLAEEYYDKLVQLRKLESL